MAKQIFKSEQELQKWLHEKLEADSALNELIVNTEEIETAAATSLSESKVLESYKYCLQSLNIVDVLAENTNISLKEGDVLKPDFLLYAPETQSIVIVEIKNLVSPSRQVGTEVSAYANEIRSYIPFTSDGDIINLIISPVWPTLLTHYVFHEIFWLQRSILCLEPVEIDGVVKLRIVATSVIIQEKVSLKLANEHLGGYRICLYDDEMHRGGSRKRLDQHVPQMKTAIAAMAVKGNAQKNNGFAFLWKDNWHLSTAPYNITIMNIAPFQTIERFFHDEYFEPNEMTEKLIHIVQEHAPEGHGYSLETISKYGERFLEEICNIRPEGFTAWPTHRRDITENSELISFFGWGIFGELHADKLIKEYRNGNISVLPDDPNLGLALIDELIDPSYEFIDLHYLNFDPSDMDEVDEPE